MHMNIDCFMLFISFQKTAISFLFSEFSSDRTRRTAVVVAQSLLHLLVSMVVFSANAVLCPGAQSGRSATDAVNCFQSRQLRLSCNTDLKFLVIRCLHLDMDTVVEPNSTLTWQGNSQNYFFLCDSAFANQHSLVTACLC